MRIYISGPIRGREDYEERFAEAASAIKAAGHTYVNPAVLSRLIPDMDDFWYLKYDSGLLLLCDAVCYLPGSDKSQGCAEEREWAKKLGLPVYDIHTGLFDSGRSMDYTVIDYSEGGTIYD